MYSYLTPEYAKFGRSEGPQSISIGGKKMGPVGVYTI